MKLNVYALITLFFLALLFTACNKGPGVIPLTSSTNLPGSGTTTPPGTGTTPTPGTGTTMPVISTYQPFTTGTTWRYQQTDGADIDTVKVTVTGKTKTFSSKIFYEILDESKTGKDTSYLYFGNNNYISNSEDYADGIGTEILYLNDKEAVGYTWSGEAVTGAPGTVTYTGKIIEKSISKTILGKTYADIIHTQVVITISLGPITGKATCDFYLAKGIGIVQVDTNDGSDTTSSKLISYTVK